MVYKIVGNLRSPYFFDIRRDPITNKAVVTLKNSLLGDPVTNYDVSFFL
jgi:hypothetical protein